MSGFKDLVAIRRVFMQGVPPVTRCGYTRNFRTPPFNVGVFENIRRRIEGLSYGMPRIRSMTSKKDCHSEPSFLSSRVKRGISWKGCLADARHYMTGDFSNIPPFNF